jgi:hypothetical protein
VKVNQFVKDALRLRRDKRDMAKAGWEFVGERGGDLWELYRGGRGRHRIVDVRIAACGRALWIKTEETAL